MRELDDGLGAMEREFDDLEARPSARLGAASDGPAARAHPARRGSAERVARSAAAKAAGSGTVAATAAAAALALVSSPKVRGLRLSASPVGVGVCVRAFVSRGPNATPRLAARSAALAFGRTFGEAAGCEATFRRWRAERLALAGIRQARAGRTSTRKSTPREARAGVEPAARLHPDPPAPPPPPRPAR